MKLRWFIPIMVLLPLPLRGVEPVPPARILTIVINPSEVTPLHLRPEFDSVVRMPEEVTSVVLGSPESFKAEHNEGEPRYVYVKPITREPAISKGYLLDLIRSFLAPHAWCALERDSELTQSYIADEEE
jgi:hypothetical protein